ncbi:acyltransferase domain-containing protein, partial [Streptomyces parvulus]
ADGARVVALRSRAIAAELAGHGGMVAVQRPLAEVEGILAACDGELTVAAVNGPGSTVVSGGTAALDELMAQCERRGIRSRRIPVDYASHSGQVDALTDRILADLAPIRAGRAQVPFFSTVTGDCLLGAQPPAPGALRGGRTGVGRRRLRRLRGMQRPPGARREYDAHPGGDRQRRRRDRLTAAR